MNMGTDKTILELFTPGGSEENHYRYPMYSDRVEAGFPSPAQDYVEQSMDLNDVCIKHPAATFFVRVKGDSMVDGGIYDGDVLIVDSALDPRHGDIVIAAVGDELTVKKLEIQPQRRLVPMNRAYRPVVIDPETDITILGVVSHAIHSFRHI